MIVWEVSAVTVDDIIQTELEEAKLGNVIENVHANKRKSRQQCGAEGYKSTSNARNCKLNLRLQTASKNRLNYERNDTRRKLLSFINC